MTDEQKGEWLRRNVEQMQRNRDRSRDRIAHSIMTYSWESDMLDDLPSPVEAYDLADHILGSLLAREGVGDE